MAPAIETAVRILRDRGANLEVGAYANAFDAYQEDGGANQTLHPLRPDLTGEAYLAFARRWTDAGATLIGGCCGVGAEHIARLADLFE